MTTIATDGKTMSCDSQASIDENLIANLDVKKIHHLPDGSVIGGAGVQYELEHYIRWLQDPNRDENKEPYPGDNNYIKLTPDGGIFMFARKGHPWHKLDGPWAIGSGANFAIGAMHAGGTPAQAVAAAIRYDKGSGGKIQTLTPRVKKGDK